MKHVDMRSLTPEAQEERRRQVIGLRQAGQTYAAIAAQVAARLSQPTVLPDIPLSCCLDPTGRSRHGVSSA